MADLLGTFEQAVLLAIVHLGPDAYGRAILKQVHNLLQRNVSAGSVYTTLDRLEARGLLKSKLAAGTPSRSGRARRYYTVAAQGKHALSDARKTLASMWSSVDMPLRVKS
jgi:DNA-binding PadR family transcriptional regulator